jgi:hypothetical protein
MMAGTHRARIEDWGNGKGRDRAQDSPWSPNLAGATLGGAERELRSNGGGGDRFRENCD